MVEGTQYLIRIDPTSIVFSYWCLIFRSTKRIDRPEKLELIQQQIQSGNWLFKGLPQWWAYFPAKQHVIVWLREVLDEFETDRHSRAGGNPDERLSSLDSRFRRNAGKAFRSVLQTMEYNGKPLERVLHPSQERKSGDTVAGSLDVCSLVVRCPHCDAALPRENVWFEEAAGQCAECRRVFQIGDMKDRTPPKRCRIDFQEDAAGLHLHQKPRHINILSVSLLVVVVYFPVIYGVLSMREGNRIPIPFDWEILRIASGFLVFTAVLVFISVRTFHVHRFVDFGHETVQFRTRWLFWERCRSVSRSELGTFCGGQLFDEFFHGIYIRYGKNRSFYLLATVTEKLYLVSTVNRWLWRNPPELRLGK
jgi:hypothetical protein